MGNGYRELLAQRPGVMRALGMMQPQGMQNNQIIPGQTVQPGYPGGGSIGAPGMMPGDVSPEIDAALLRKATDPSFGCLITCHHTARRR